MNRERGREDDEIDFWLGFPFSQMAKVPYMYWWSYQLPNQRISFYKA